MAKMRNDVLNESDAEYPHDKVDSVNAMDKKDKLHYFGGKKNDAGTKQVLIDSGVIDTDEKLDSMSKTETAGKKFMKSLQELTDDGIFTVDDTAYEHSTKGVFSNVRNSKKPAVGANGGNLVGGGHTQTNIEELNARGINYSIETGKNNIRIGGVENHEKEEKRLGKAGQAWFPDD